MANREVATASAELKVFISPMTEHDLLEVVEIEDLSGVSPWGWDAYHKELQAAGNVIMLVARIEDQASLAPQQPALAGFVVSRLVADELHVNNVAVRSEFRRQGVGIELLEAVLLWGRGKRARMALLEVRAGNSAAQGLYASCGFKVSGRRRHYYSRPVEDALLMSLSLVESR